MPDSKPHPTSAHEQRLRREALAAADRSNQMEGLPPPSAHAVAVGERYIRGEITVDQAVAEVLKPYRAC